MPVRSVLLQVATLFVLFPPILLRGQQSSQFFETSIRPVLAKQCLGCHGQAAMGGLQLNSREHLLKGGQSGPAIVPGKPDESLLVQAVRRVHSRFKMPPQAPLPASDVNNLVEWVRAGAEWPTVGASEPTGKAGKFWAFQPVHKPAVPDISPESKEITDLDRFILVRLEEKGLHRVRPADKRSLLRRATFDLIGLPPAPEEIEAFVNDTSPHAFEKVVDRLLASPHYGERWGRHWLDLARYSDGQLGASKDTPFPNAFRYRDWVVQAFNNDLPYDLFVKGQIAADLLAPDQSAKLLPGLGFYALGPDEDDRVDVTGQVFLGFTVGCAKCHDHKYDPIPTKDFYSLLGVFKSTEKDEYPLAGAQEVERYKKLKKQIDEKKIAIEDFVQKHSTELSELLAAKTSRYLMAAWELANSKESDAATVARECKLDETTLKHWAAYLSGTERDHKFLNPWDQLVARHAGKGEFQKFADEFQTFVVSMFAEKHAMEDRNYVKLGGAAGVRDEKTRQYTNLESLPIEKYYLWRDLASEPYKKDFVDFKGGVYYYGPKEIDRFLSSEWREHHEEMNSDLARLEKEQPPQYAFLHSMKDAKTPADIKVYVRGDEKNPGEVAPRRFLSALSDGEPVPFRSGSGRLELANLIATPSNPLFARVMVNRIWQHHFGTGIVSTASNFGQLGDRPSHPELLDYLAAEFVEHGWSVKAMHRLIMLSSTYQLSTELDAKNMAVDPGNRLLWRSSVRPRLDAEALRDSLLFVSGKLDPKIGGPSLPLDKDNARRTIYAQVNRTKPDAELALFDFPNPNMTSEQRMVTVGPMQRLYLMNNEFVTSQAKALAGRLSTEPDDAKRIESAYQICFGRDPSENEVKAGRQFLASGHALAEYAHVLLLSSEFSSVN